MEKKYSLVYSITSFFVFLAIVFIPFPFHLLDFRQDVTDAVFGSLIGWTARSLFHIPLKSTLVYSDSVSMYILVLILFLLSIILAIVFSRTGRLRSWQHRFFVVVRIVGVYYLFLTLFKYGLDKVFKTQFYLPEPNTLYTPLGQVDKDLLFWSSMGTSRFYNICTGLAEVLAAMLMLFRRTRMSGLLLSALIMIQVSAMNFGFDISVKLFSLFLLFLSFYLMHPYFRVMSAFLFGIGKIPSDPLPAEPVIKRRRFGTIFLQFLVPGLLMLEAFYPYIRSGNFNDDNASRPYLHGAYEVTEMINGGDTLSPSAFPVRRFFIHRNGYLIFQDRQDRMKDYNFSYDTELYKYVLTDYRQKKTEVDISYRLSDSLLTLQYLQEGRQVILKGRGLNWRQLPTLRRSFHWTVDEY